jgi:hypothetical protein
MNKGLTDAPALSTTARRAARHLYVTCRTEAPLRNPDTIRRQGAPFELGGIELEWRPDALKSDTTSRRTHLQAILSQSGSPFPHPDGRCDLQPAVPAWRLIPSRSRPSWRGGVPERRAPSCRTGLQTVAGESRTADRPPECRRDLQSNVSRRRPGTARGRPPYPSLERRIAIQPVLSA